MNNNKRANNFKDLTGKVFGRLTALKLDIVKKEKTYWLCQCECGNIKIISLSNLISNDTKSCGCLKKEKSAASLFKHGMSKTRFYNIWTGIKSRCLNANVINYECYGGSGITVCDRWLDFNNFKDDMYESYLKHVEEFGEKDTTLDRINVKDNYYKDNCKWATQREQQRNRQDSSITENYDQHKYWKKKLGTRLSSVISCGYKTSSILEFYLDCTIDEFKIYLESKFTIGMSWSNYGRGKGKWQLDHIIGCNNFDLSKEEDRLECWNYKNLRPIWHEDHKRKSTKRQNISEGNYVKI